ncbi:centromere protein F [Nematostella vectensis]|uniref:centromere protein F n=1 Tax=Nematostella vectensis TaxID=45351 RepID=UPI002077413E|nr:centromere protein F [Nematostella vectensis]
MSWAKEEWKQDLPSKTLQNIHQLENELEALRKQIQQQDLRIDGYISSMEKQKKELSEEKALNAVLQRDVQEMCTKISNFEVKEEKLTAEIKAKDKQVELGEEVLQKVQLKLKEENARVVELEGSLEQRKKEADGYRERNEKLAAEIEKLQQGKDHLTKECEASSEKIVTLLKEIELLRQTRSAENVHIEEATSNEKEREATEVKETESNEKEREATEVKETESNESSGDALVEILRRENSGLVYQNQDLKIQRDQLRHKVEEKTNEVERNISKTAGIRSELEKTKKALKGSEERVSSLGETVEARESTIRTLECRVDDLERQKKKIKEKLECVSFNTQAARASKSQLLREYDEHAKEMKRLEEELNKAKASLKDKQDQLLALDTKYKELITDNEGLKDQMRGLRETANSATQELKKKEQLLRALATERQSSGDSERKRLEKLECLLLENDSLRRHVETMDCDAKEARKEYESVTQALESSRNLVQLMTEKIVDLEKASSRPVDAADAVDSWIKCQDTNVVKEVQGSEDNKTLASTQTEVAGNLLDSLQSHIRDLKARIRELEEDKRTLEGSAQEQDQIVEELITQLEYEKSRYQGNEDDADDETEITATAGEKDVLSEVFVVKMEAASNEPTHPLSDDCKSHEHDVTVENTGGDQEEGVTEGQRLDVGFSEDWYTLCADVQREHKTLRCGVEECCNTSQRVEELLQDGEHIDNELQPVAQSIRYLMNQLQALKVVLQRCDQSMMGKKDEGGKLDDEDQKPDDVDEKEKPLESSEEQGEEDIARKAADKGYNSSSTKENAVSTPTEYRMPVTCEEIPAEYVSRESNNSRKDEKSATEDQGVNCFTKSGAGSKQMANVHDSESDGAKDSPRKDLSWDNFEAENAFQPFKKEVDSVVRQIDQNADKAEGKRNCHKKMTRSKSEGSEEHLEEDESNEKQLDSAEIANILKGLLVENNDVIFERMKRHFTEIERLMLSNASNKDSELQRKKVNKEQSSSDREDFKDDDVGALETRSVQDGRYAMEEIEIMRRKMADIQKSIKQLISSTESAEKKRVIAHSHLSLLENEFKEKESHYEMRCGELESAVRTASQQGIALQRQLSNLRTEKDDIQCDFQEVLQALKMKEMELVKATQQLGHMEAEHRENEAKLRNKIEALEQENEVIWQDFTDASHKAQEKDTEFRGVVDQLKNSEKSVLELFNSLGNIDDQLQRAKHHQLYE